MSCARKPYTGRLQAVIFDLAGTTVDYGSLAPVRVLQQVFAAQGIQVSEDEARRDMGVLKKDHIRALLGYPRIRAAWEKQHGYMPGEADVERVFDDFVPRQMECLAQYSAPIPGVVERVRQLRDRGLKIGSTTGYTRPMLEILLRHAAHLGYAPDCSLCPDDVGAGRPYPWMIYESAVRMKVAPLEAVVKVGDTISDIEEGLNAGTWAVGVAQTGNMIGVTEEEWRNWPESKRSTRLQDARNKLLAAGAHYVVDTLADFDQLVDQIEARLTAGERP
ncbi:MAG: phosphonoacetaldehyde hydrolase [Candidatus Korobacteraceae bacterium]